MRVRDSRGNLIANVPTAWLRRRLWEMKAARVKLSPAVLRSLTWEFLALREELRRGDVAWALGPGWQVAEPPDGSRRVEPLWSLEDHDLLDDSTEEQAL